MRTNFIAFRRLHSTLIKIFQSLCCIALNLSVNKRYIHLFTIIHLSWYESTMMTHLDAICIWQEAENKQERCHPSIINVGI